MQKPSRFVVRMFLFLLIFAGLSAFLRDRMIEAFLANPGLNGVILGTLVIGIIYAMRRVFDLYGEVTWITAFKRRDEVPVDSGKATRLMAPAAAMLASHESGEMKLSTLSMRSVLDGIASRLEESREISRYLTGLLIFLGLLGTFWGLLGTIGAIGSTISGLTVDWGDPALMFDALKDGLEAPLSGMGTAFSSSLFGLAGSLVLGFMDLQASQAQTRFYNDVEEWLASVTQLSRGSGLEEGVGPSAYMTALMEQTADGIDKLTRTLGRGDDGRVQLQTSMTEVAEAIAALGDKLAADRAQSLSDSKALATAIEQLAAKDGGALEPVPALDEASKGHIRNVDVGIKRLIEEQARQNEMLVDELRAELKLLARTIAAGIDQANLGGAAAKAPSVKAPQPTAATGLTAPPGEPSAETAPPVLTAKRDDEEPATRPDPLSGPRFNPFEGPGKKDGS